MTDRSAPEQERLSDRVARYVIEKRRLTAEELEALSAVQGADGSDLLLRELFRRRLLDAQEMAEILASFQGGRAASGCGSPVAGVEAAQGFGRYRILGELGGGGMGRVLLGEDPFLSRQVALKVIRGDPSEKQVRRFVREARVNGQLTHPNVVPVHDFGISTDGRPYLAMKRVVGRTLKEVLAEAGGDPEGLPAMLRVYVKLCEAVGYAHSRGVIHRDLKPANVMVAEFGEVMLVDWGLARLERTGPARPESSDVQLPRTDDPDLTIEGEIMGTLPYMSPEQAMGGKALDHLTDIYALGAILYQILAGVPPFTGSRWQEVRAAVIRGKPRPPSEVAKGRVVPWELESVAMKALSRTPGARPDQALALKRAVEAYLEGQVLDNIRYSARQLAAKWIALHRGQLAVALAIGVSLLVVGSTVLYRGVQARREALALASVTRSLRGAEQRAMRSRSRSLLLKERQVRWTREFLGLADELRIGELLEASELLGPQAWKAEELRRWLRRAGELGGRADQHRRRLKALKASRSPDEAALRAWRTPRLERLVARLPELSARRRWAQRCLEAVETLPRLTPGQAASWRRARRSIRQARAYEGLDLVPQEGLLPIGPDPVSGLWEFAHLASGAPARRDGSGKLSLGPATGIVLVLLPGGETSGPPVEQGGDAAWRLRLAPFFCSKYEVTRAQFRRMAARLGDRALIKAASTDLISGAVGPLAPLRTGRWRVARRVLASQGLRLPTEVQWRFAASGLRRTRWWTGDDLESLRGAENVADSTFVAAMARSGERVRLPGVPWNDGFPFLAPVGSFRPNPFGLCDMVGNAREWCRDRWVKSGPLMPRAGRDGLPRIPDGTPASVHVSAGGDYSWYPDVARPYPRHSLLEGQGLAALRPVRSVRR